MYQQLIAIFNKRKWRFMNIVVCLDGIFDDRFLCKLWPCTDAAAATFAHTKFDWVIPCILVIATLAIFRKCVTILFAE